jgi:hypothetical protein
VPTRPGTKITYSAQEIANLGFDVDFLTSTVEMLGFDPLAEAGVGALKRVTTNALGEYQTNDVDETTTASVTYVGKEDAAGDWFVQKVDQTLGTSIRYATVKNNPTISSYSDAWTIRATTLDYDTYGEAF